MSLLTNRQERTRFLRFLVVGLIGAVVDFGTFNLLTLLVHVPAIWASVCSFTAAIISNFIWNRFWIYPDSRTKSILRQLVQFAVVNVVGLLIRTPLFATLDPPLRAFFSSSFSSLPLPADVIGHNLALAIAVGVVLIWNFFVNRYWTYNDVSAS